MTKIEPHIASFYDAATGTISHVLADVNSAKAAIIDPVLDFDPKSGALTSARMDRIVDYVSQQRLASRMDFGNTRPR